MSAVTPSYYLVHDTPVGARYAYPLTLVSLAKRSYSSAPWEVGGTTIAEPSSTSFEVRGDWLVADAPIVWLRRESPGPLVRDGWKKTAALDSQGPVSPDLAAAFASLPEQPTPQDVAHFVEHDAAHACWQCRVFSAAYEARYVSSDPVVETQSFDGWLPLPGDIDPAPSRTWQVDDTSLLSIYGRHTAHLWPGVLLGLREPVIERLKAHPLVSTVIDSISKGATLWVRIPWETPKSRVTHVKPYGKRKTVAKTVPVYAMETRLEMQFPDGISATTKASAVDSFDAAVDRQVERVLPFGEDPAACDHCEGLGWVRRA